MTKIEAMPSKRFLRILSYGILFIFIVILSGCNRRGKYKIILPDDYRGPVYIMLGNEAENFANDTVFIYVDSLGLARTKGYPNYRVDNNNVCFSFHSKPDTCILSLNRKKDIISHMDTVGGVMVLGLHFNPYRDFLLDSGDRITLENGYFQAYVDTMIPTRNWIHDMKINVNKLRIEAYRTMPRY